MPARPNVPFVASVVLKGTAAGGLTNWVNKLYVHYTGAAPIALDLENYAEALMGEWVSVMTPLQSNETNIVDIEVTDLASDMGAVGIYTLPTTGTLAGGRIPASTAVLINYKLARHYRGGHPRTYLCVGDDTKLEDAATWESAFITAVLSAWNGIQGALIIGSGSFNPGEQVNVSYFGPPTLVGGGSTPRVTPQVDEILVSNTSASQRLANQRRRIGRK